MDAANDLAWGTQGLLYLSSSANSLQTAALGLGIAGALTQTTVGILRIHKGITKGERPLIKLGALDVGGGLLWLGWDLIGWEQPLFIGSYVVLMIAREAYANKEAMYRLRGRAAQLTRRAKAGCVECLRDVVDEAQANMATILEGAKTLRLAPLRDM